MDRIALRGIRVWGRHGANPGEQDVPQPFDVELEIELDLERAAKTDELPETLDYDKLHRVVRSIVETKNYALLERLAADIVDAVLRDVRVDAVAVTVGKPGLLAGATPSITLRRRR